MKGRLFLSPVLVSLLTLAGTNAIASPFQLTFVGLQNDEEVLNYYDGGLAAWDPVEGPIMASRSRRVSLRLRFLVFPAAPMQER
jgi:hypothetical protein